MRSFMTHALLLTAAAAVLFLAGCSITGDAVTGSPAADSPRIAASDAAGGHDAGDIDPMDQFAKCLTDAGARMYGSDYCSHCKRQKKLFGESFAYVNYTECTKEKAVCRQAGVKAYPTWIVEGKHYRGRQSLRKLSSLTSCELPDSHGAGISDSKDSN